MCPNEDFEFCVPNPTLSISHAVVTEQLYIISDLGELVYHAVEVTEPFLTKTKQNFLEKWLIPGLGEDVYKVYLECLVPENKELLEE